MTDTEPNAPEIIVVNNSADEARCDGGGGALGHPVVWYSFAGKDTAECLYCDRLFVKERAAGTYQGKQRRA